MQWTQQQQLAASTSGTWTGYSTTQAISFGSPDSSSVDPHRDLSQENVGNRPRGMHKGRSRMAHMLSSDSDTDSSESEADTVSPPTKLDAKGTVEEEVGER